MNWRAVSSGNGGFEFVAPGRGKQALIAPDVAQVAIDARRSGLVTGVHRARVGPERGGPSSGQKTAPASVRGFADKTFAPCSTRRVHAVPRPEHCRATAFGKMPKDLDLRKVRQDCRWTGPGRTLVVPAGPLCRPPRRERRRGRVFRSRRRCRLLRMTTRPGRTAQVWRRTSFTSTVSRCRPRPAVAP